MSHFAGLRYHPTLTGHGDPGRFESFFWDYYCMCIDASCWSYIFKNNSITWLNISIFVAVLLSMNPTQSHDHRYKSFFADEGKVQPE